MHQLGILPAAVHYYKQVLNSKPQLKDEVFSLEREAAFNLSLIYKNSGANDLARRILHNHIVI
jgi:general transcription factor 3C polypeptide 3 (transcription factor C subunit 4)